MAAPIPSNLSPAVKQNEGAATPQARNPREQSNGDEAKTPAGMNSSERLSLSPIGLQLNQPRPDSQAALTTAEQAHAMAAQLQELIGNQPEAAVRAHGGNTTAAVAQLLRNN